MRLLRTFGRGLRIGLVAIGALAFVGTVIALATNYTVTQGTGTTFGSIVVGGVNYAQQLICDMTTPSQCAAVSASGAIKVDNSAVTQPVSAAASSIVSSAAVDGWDLTQGAQANTACATDNGSCSVVALIKRTNQNLTTLNSTAGASLPAGSATIGAVFGTGTAGTPAAGTLTVQGITSGTPVASNTAQVNGVTSLTGTGAVGTGSPRVAVGTDTATIAGSAPSINLNVINGANLYIAEPASTSITALSGGGGGATGDYLSHCTVIPTTVSPGVFTITDNATAIYSFPGGASSLSNLVPFTIPVGAKSSSGAWKVTTGAGLSIVCVGKFT